MKRLSFISLCLLLILPCTANAEVGFRGRGSITADWKAFKGFHVSAGYEIRSKDSFSGIERHQAGIDVSYKVNKWFKTGIGYDFIGHYNSSSSFEPRHRTYLDLTGILPVGNWRLSLKERFQMTHKSYDINSFQEVKNELGLKSRLKVSYNGYRPLQPYAYVELRNTFNAPNCTADYDESTGKYSNYSFTGYNDVYLNRVRSALGLVWRITKHHSIDFYGMMDWNHDKKIDTNKEGTKLKSINWENSWCGIIGLGYKFSF